MIETHRAGFAPHYLDYERGWRLQRATHASVLAGDVPQCLILCEHSPVYTAGTSSRTSEFPRDGSVPVPVSRGGRVTWHGPGQLVGYPIMALPPLRGSGGVDVVGHVRRLEGVLIALLAEWGVLGERVEGRSGVWVRDPEPGAHATPGAGAGASAGATAGAGTAASAGAGDAARAGAGDAARFSKIAAIGIRVEAGLSLHGFALNCGPDLSGFEQIVPCGISDAGVTSISRVIGTEVTPAEAADALGDRFESLYRAAVPDSGGGASPARRDRAGVLA